MCGTLLLTALPSLAWSQQSCGSLTANQRGYAEQLVDDAALHADAGQVDLQAYGISRLSGGARLRFGREILLADDVQYEHAKRRIDVFGQTLFESDALQVRALGAQIRLDEQQASFDNAQYIAYAAGARGAAGKLQANGPNQIRLEAVRYTTCAEDDEAWVLESDEIRLDANKGMGSARNARLRFMGVPIFWAPVLYFPVGDQRQTGLLPPRIGENGNTGLDISLPIYFNLAPQADLLLTPRYMATRGLQLAATARYLWPHSSFESTAEWLGNDEQTSEKRYLVSNQIEGGTRQHWNWQVNYTRLSDIEYLSDLEPEGIDPAQNQLPRYARLSYAHEKLGLEAVISAHDYQSLLPSSSSNTRPYERVPEFNLNWRRGYANGRVRPSLRLNAVQFRRDDSISAWRGDTKIALDWRLDSPQAFASAHTDYRYTTWQVAQTAASDESFERQLPSLQASTGLNFIRLGKQGNFQTLTPQITYLFVPHRDQDGLPIFDAALPDFSFDQLFALNRFSGTDRVADANLITTALRTDWFSDGGKQRRLSGKLGVQWRLDSAIVTLPGEQPAQSGSSDWLGELDYALNQRLSTQLVGQWNAEENRMDQSSVAFRYSYNENKFAYLAYRFRRNNYEQTDAIVSLPISSRWNVAARWTYSIAERRSLEALGGLEYKSCCWGAQVAWRRYLSSNGGEFDSSIYVQLELNGLGKIGQGLDRLLTRDIL
ncbi:MAG: LPS-assembly protein LptD [Oceanococcus sp.]